MNIRGFCDDRFVKYWNDVGHILAFRHSKHTSGT